MADQTDFVALAGQWQGGDRKAGDALFSSLDGELRQIAAAKLRSERNTSLSTGDLINEAVIRLSRLTVMEFHGRSHILALASHLMRRVLIDAARQRNALKRGETPLTLCTDVADWEIPLDLIELDLALRELEKIDPERSQIVEMRFFGGMNSADIGEVLGVSEPTIKRRWSATRAWLHDRLSR
ncbi:ECF-type sigma factor [Qipengyuania sp.]|uniref:ECF-type sigma factor n=1 Tax=Qipengyuania sp. TaxID=2004515 RepID=UPI0035C80F76